MRTNNQFKNIFKRLRNNGPASIQPKKGNRTKKENYYDCLDVNVCELEIEIELNQERVSKKNSLDLSYLPEEMINVILEYLSINTRLAILKNKYNKKFMKNKLENIPNPNYIKNLFKCAIIAEDVLTHVLKIESVVFRNLPTLSIVLFKEETYLDDFDLRYYKRKFTEIILAAFKHYSKIYNRISYGKKEKAVEQIIFRLYALLLAI
jgi:hypothetical protein